MSYCVVETVKTLDGQEKKVNELELQVVIRTCPKSFACETIYSECRPYYDYEAYLGHDEKARTLLKQTEMSKLETVYQVVKTSWPNAKEIVVLNSSGYKPPKPGKTKETDQESGWMYSFNFIVSGCGKYKQGS